MKNYYEQKNGNFISSDNQSIPNDTSNRHYKTMQQEVSDGDAEIIAYSGSDAETADKSAEERTWRDSELSRADHKVNNAEDNADSASAASWRSYRNNLRDYPQQGDFPNGTRPTAPDA